MNRKKFLRQASTGIAGLLIFPDFNDPEIENGAPVIISPDEGETYWIGSRNSPVTIKIAKDRQGNKSMSFCREAIAPGEGIPLHKHLNEDELIFLQKGEGTLTLGDHEYPFPEGSAALVPKGIWHRMYNSGNAPLIMVFSYSPAGFEGYFRELGTPEGTPWRPKSQEEFRKLDQKWGIVYR